MNKGLQKIFSEVPETYELVNRILTFGLDSLWRRKAAKAAKSKTASRFLDVCTGTGQTAVLLLGSEEEERRVVAVDFSEQMISKAKEERGMNRIDWALADAVSLPFQDETFDAVTISFATRNINVSREYMGRCLREFRRVLKPGGVFVNLETSQPRSGLVRRLFHLYVGMFVEPIGRAISGSRTGYAYLANTILHFHDADEFTEMIQQAGFSDVGCDLMLFGVVALHKAQNGEV